MVNQSEREEVRSRLRSALENTVRDLFECQSHISIDALVGKYI